MEESVDPESERPITFADLGVPTTATIKDSYFGKTRHYSDLEKKEIFFLTISLISILATIGLTIERITSVFTKGEPDFTFALLLLIHSVFILYYVIDGVFRERPYELAVFVIGVAFIMIYCITNYIGTFAEDKLNVIKLIRLVLIAVLGPADIVLGCYLTRQYYISRNLIFRTVGASAELQDICSLMYFCEALLKFDFQLEVSMFVLVLSAGTDNVETFDYVLLVVGLVYGLLWNTMGYVAIRYENKALVWTFLAFSVFGPAYIIYKMVDLGMNWNTIDQEFMYLTVVIIICAAAALIVRVVLVITMVKVYQNFGKGLKEKAYGINSADVDKKMLDQNNFQ
ncbi:uncharacterized protein LOC100374839 [Saccoglossus kowalevskii]|uniref:Uncharacterized protein LOC100374839 n=1 Tax=Saccoglossus kowalevskii TaxID=10224 RepID=A0ABM0GU31_SACKO|nr:PREDICTED: uncharacterized protein LOC100374839 [Saccoglossus kowalevskii]